MDDKGKKGRSINEFFHHLDVLVEPIVKISILSEMLNKKDKESKTPKWKRRRKGEKRPSDKWNYGERS